MKGRKEEKQEVMEQGKIEGHHEGVRKDGGRKITWEERRMVGRNERFKISRKERGGV